MPIGTAVDSTQIGISHNCQCEIKEKERRKMAKEKCITRSFPTAVVTLMDGSIKEFPNMNFETAESVCKALNLDVKSVKCEELVYAVPESVFLKHATRR